MSRIIDNMPQYVKAALLAELLEDQETVTYHQQLQKETEEINAMAKAIAEKRNNPSGAGGVEAKKLIF